MSTSASRLPSTRASGHSTAISFQQSQNNEHALGIYDLVVGCPNPHTSMAGITRVSPYIAVCLESLALCTHIRGRSGTRILASKYSPHSIVVEERAVRWDLLHCCKRGDPTQPGRPGNEAIQRRLRCWRQQTKQRHTKISFIFIYFDCRK